MDIPRLNMRSEMAKLNLKITDPEVTMEIKNAKVQTETRAASVEIRHTEGELHIDFKDWRYSALGLKTMADFARDIAAEGKQAAMANIGRVVSEGNRLAAPPRQRATPASIAAAALFDPMPDLRLAKVSPPNISYTPGRLDFQYRAGSINTSASRPEFSATLSRGKVEGYVDPKQSLRQWVTMNEYDIYQ